MSKKTDEEAQAFIDSLIINKLGSLNKIARRQSMTPQDAPYLDPKHPHYSTELATSIEVWMQLFQSGAPIKNQRYTLLEQIKAALKEKGFTGPRERSRLATSINPDYNKRGGGTHTNKKRTIKK